MDNKLSKVIKPSAGFQYSVNIQYDLENETKLSSYIPLQKSVDLLQTILRSLQPQSTERSRLLIGSYGTGKSHFSAVLLAFLARPSSLTPSIFETMTTRIGKINPQVAEDLQRELALPKFLPVVVSGAFKSFDQAVLNALANSLNAAGISDCLPETAFQAALNQVQIWQRDYPEALNLFKLNLAERGQAVSDWEARMHAFDEEAIRLFEAIYPAVTSGASFQPLFHGDASAVYLGVSAALQTKGYRGIYLVFDEFSSFLESQWEKDHGASLKKVQDFAEACNASDDRMVHALFVTHKPISQYATKYGQEVVNEWRKIEGRFKVHELYNTSSSTYELIARVIDKELTYWDTFRDRHVDEFNNLQEKVTTSLLFSDTSLNEFSDHVLYGAYPLHPVTTFCLPRFSSLVAQNERTIFTFLSTNDYYSLGDFLTRHQEQDFALLTIDQLYDYFEPQLRSTDTEDRIKKIWFSTREALARLTPEEVDEAALLKAIGVFSVLGMPTVLPITQESLKLSFWGTEICGARYDNAIKVLLNKGVLFEGGHTGALELIDPGELHLDEEVQAMVMKRRSHFSLWTYLNEQYRPPYVLAKKYNDEYHMTRYFCSQYVAVSDALRIIGYDIAEGEPGRDGMIYYVIPETEQETRELETALALLQRKRHVWIVPSVKHDDKMDKLENSLREIDALQSILRELEATKQPHKADRLLILLWIREREAEVRSLMNELFAWTAVKVYPQFSKQPVRSKADLSRLVSEICYNHYSATPKWNNEMINKNRLSRPIQMARQKVVHGLLRPVLEPSLGLTGTGPDMAIFRSLLRHTGIVVQREGEEIPTLNLCSDDNDTALAKIMNALRKVFDASGDEGVEFSRLLHLLQREPFGLRQGIIPIVLAIYLHQNRNELMLVNAAGEELPWTAEQIDAAMNEPTQFSVQRFNWSREKSLLCELLAEVFVQYTDVADIAGQSRRIVKMMKRWLLSLPRYSRDTRNVSEQAREFRRLLKQWNISSGQLLFVELPKVFGVEMADDAGVRSYAACMENVKTEIEGRFHTAFSQLEKDLVAQVPEKYRGVHLLASLRKWYGALSDEQRSHLYSDATQDFLFTVRSFVGENHEEFMHQLFSRLAGARMEDWNDGTSEIVREQFVFALEEVADHRGKATCADLANEFRVTYVDSEGTKINRTFAKTEITPTAEILETVLASHLRQFGDAISKHEKCEILVRLLQSVVK